MRVPCRRLSGARAQRSIPWYRSDENDRITFTTPGTPGGGYSVSVEAGTPSLDGDADETSSQSECANL